MKDFYYRYKEIIDKTAMVIAFLLGLYVFFKYIFILVLPFIIGYAISKILDPFVNFLNKKFKISRGICAVVGILMLYGIIILLGVTIVKQIVEEGRMLYQNSPELIEQSKDAIDKFNGVIDRLFFYIPDGIAENVRDMLSSFLIGLQGKIIESLKDASIVVAKGIPKGFSIFIIGSLSAFFFIKDKELIKVNVAKATPNLVKKGVGGIRQESLRMMGGYVKAQLTLMTITGIICTIALLIMGYEYAFVVGFIIALIDAIPMFGSGFVLWPWALYSFITGDIFRSLYLLGIYGIVFLTRQLLEPKVLSTNINLHPLFTMFGVYVGLQLFGVGGMILGPIVIVFIKYIIES